jgi:hypothetical protein
MTACWRRLTQHEKTRSKKASGEGSESMAEACPRHRSGSKVRACPYHRLTDRAEVADPSTATVRNA